MHRPRRVPELSRALAVVVLALLPLAVFAEGLSAQVEEDYTNTSTRSTDQTDRTVSSTTQEFAQHYRLMFDRKLSPLLQVDAIGLFDNIQDWLTNDGVPSRSDEWRAGGAAHLRLGSQVLGGDLGYERHDDSTSSTLGGSRLHTIGEQYSAHAAWRPAEMPSLDLRLLQTNSRDADRRVADSTTNDALLSTEYNAFRQLRVGYYLDYTLGKDRLTGTETTVLNNNGRVTYNDTFNGGRTSLVATYQFNNRLADTSVQSALGGTVATPQLPSAGLSLIEVFPAIPETDTLGQNPALVDGNLTAPASVNVNLGSSVTIGGDTNPRDLGLQFADPNTPVNTLYVWVDRQLPIEVSSAYVWTAYRSDDNVNWTQVNVVGQVAFSAFQNRFEITIAQTRARYLKVVTRPLAPVVTVDRRFSDVFVTELQAFLVVSAQSVRGTFSSTSHTATAAFRQQLLARPMLQYDFSGVLTSGTGGFSYTVQNGLSLTHRLSPLLLLDARLGRQDTGQAPPGQPGQHSGAIQYGASLTARPLPTLTDSLTYTGQYVQTAHGYSKLNAVTFVNRAELYRGVDALASLGYGYNLLDSGALSQGPTAVATLSLAPHPALTMATSFYYTSTRQAGGNLPELRSENERVDASVNFSPFSTLYLTGSVSRIIAGARPTTLATVGGTFSPFPDGALLLRTSYTESLDTAQNLKQAVANAGVRWNIRPGFFLDVNYSLLDSSSEAGSSNTRALLATLSLQL